MKLRKLLFFFSILAAIAVFGCARSADQRAGTSETPILTELSSPVEIVLWHTLTDHQNDALQRIIDSFNAQHPFITVVQQSHPRTDFDPRLMQAVRNGVGPDMVSTFADEASNYILENYLIDFSPYLNNAAIGVPGFRNTIPPGSYVDITQWGGDRVFMLPVIATGPVFYYNKTLYDRLGLVAPRTWSELEANSRIIAAETGRPAFGVDSLQDLYNSLIMQGGARYINTETRTVGFDNEIGLEKLTWFASLVQEGVFRLVGQDSFFSNPFGSGAVASYIGSSGGVDFVREAIGGRFAFDVAPIPVEGPAVWVPTYNMAYVGFTSTPERELAVYEFYKYFMRPEVAAQWAIEYSAIPIPVAALQDPEFQAYAETQISVRALVAQANRIGGLPAIAGASTVRSQIFRMMETAALGVKTPAEALADCVEASNRELALYR